MEYTPQPNIERNWPTCERTVDGKFCSTWKLEFGTSLEGLDVEQLSVHSSAFLTALTQEMYRDGRAIFDCNFRKSPTALEITIETAEHIIEIQNLIPLACLFKSLHSLFGPLTSVQDQAPNDWFQLTHLFRKPISTARQIQDSTNSATICLVQAMIGLLSSNFRRISFRLSGKNMMILFELYREAKEDINEIADILFELEAMLVGELEINYAVRTGDLAELDEGSRIVFSTRSDD